MSLILNLLFKITTINMVFQKNAAGQLLVSVIARIIVQTNMTTSMKIDHKIRVVRFPLKILKFFYFQGAKFLEDGS